MLLFLPQFFLLSYFQPWWCLITALGNFQLKILFEQRDLHIKGETNMIQNHAHPSHLLSSRCAKLHAVWQTGSVCFLLYPLSFPQQLLSWMASIPHHSPVVSRWLTAIMTAQIPFACSNSRIPILGPRTLHFIWTLHITCQGMEPQDSHTWFHLTISTWYCPLLFSGIAQSQHQKNAVLT